MLPEGLPARTLGWEVLDWCSRFLVNPDSYGGVKGEQWIFRPDQAHFILWFYAVDEDGEWLYRRAYRERAKGTGKSPMVAAIACAEFLGPTKFSHFNAEGQAVGVEHDDPMVWLAAISLDGSDHTYKYVMGMLEGKAETYYNLDIGMTRILAKGFKSSKIVKQVTASPKSLEGPKPTFVICEETQNWTPAEQGPQLMAVIHRGLTKTDGRRIEVTNAPVPGQNTVAEETHKFWNEVLDGEAEAEGLLFDTFSIAVKDLQDKEEVMAALGIMYEHCPWIKLNRVWRDIQDPSHSAVDSRRFFFNQIMPPNAMWLSEDDWWAAQAPVRLRRTDKLAIGVRVKKHSAALIATRLEDQAQFVVKIWERPDSVDTPRDWEVPYIELDLVFRKLMRTHKVCYVAGSPDGFQDILIKWQADFEGDRCGCRKQEVTFEAIWLNRNKQKFADAVDLYEQAVWNKRMCHDGDEILRKHIMNSFVNEIPQGRTLRTDIPHSKRYIVAAEAALLSLQAAQEARSDGHLDDGPSNALLSF